MVTQMDAELFGGCSWFGECQEACPKEISIDTITRMNGDFLRGSVAARADGEPLARRCCCSPWRPRAAAQSVATSVGCPGRSGSTPSDLVPGGGTSR